MAVIVALSAVMLFSVAALCVDLGNAYSRKRSLQTQADFAAFAAVKGGANLPAATTTPLASQDAVIQAAAYLNRNLPQDDAQGPRTCEAATPPTCITAAQLVNGRLADGEVKYGHYVGGLSGTFVPSKNEITVITPKSLVDYGLAQAMGPGHDSLNLQTKATVAIKSANISTLPFYAYTGCDYGPQTISEPNNGHAATTVNLFAPTATNAATITSLTPNDGASEQHDDHGHHHRDEPEHRLARRLLRVRATPRPGRTLRAPPTRPWSRRRRPTRRSRSPFRPR